MSKYNYSLEEYVKYNELDSTLTSLIDALVEDNVVHVKAIDRLESKLELAIEQCSFAEDTLTDIKKALSKASNSKVKQELLAILSNSSFEL